MHAAALPDARRRLAQRRRQAHHLARLRWLPLLLLGAASLRRYRDCCRRPGRQLRRPLLRPGPQLCRRERLDDPGRRRRDRRARAARQPLAATPAFHLHRTGAPMTRLAVFALALALLAAGCSGGKNAAPPQPPQTSATGSTTSG